MLDKSKPDENHGRKATGPRFLREATERLSDGPQDRRAAEGIGLCEFLIQTATRSLRFHQKKIAIQ